MRAAFEARTGAFSPEDPWFEERSRAFWSDAVTRGRFGREVEEELTPDDRHWLGPLERAHRGLFYRGHRGRAGRAQGAGVRPRGEGEVLTDVWSGAEMLVTTMDDASRAELDAAAGQLLDARVVGGMCENEREGEREDEPIEIALLPGAIFHPHDATAAIEQVVEVARGRDLSTHETLDALLRMERSLRALSRVKATYAYRPEALAAPAPPAATRPVRRHTREPT